MKASDVVFFVPDIGVWCIVMVFLSTVSPILPWVSIAIGVWAAHRNIQARRRAPKVVPHG